MLWAAESSVSATPGGAVAEAVLSGGMVAELDIEFDSTYNWNYGPGAPAFSQYDFESVAVHELGHGQQLGHVINSAEIVHYSISNGQTKRALECK